MFTQYPDNQSKNNQGFKMRKSLLAAAMAAVFLAGCDSAVNNGESTQTPVKDVAASVVASPVEQLASALNFQYQVVNSRATDVDCASLGAEWGSCSRSQVVLSTDTDFDIDGNWVMYAHSVRRILQLDAEGWRVEHVTGDLHRIYPPKDFTGFKANQQVRLPIVTEHSLLFVTTVMPNWYLVGESGEPFVIAATATNTVKDFVAPFSDGQWNSGSDDKNILMTADTRFERYQSITPIAAEELSVDIIPTPLSSNFSGEMIDASALSIGGNVAVAQRFGLTDRLAKVGVTAAAEGTALMLSIDESLPAEGYKLSIASDGVSASAGSEQGLIWAMQSLLALVNKGQLPIGEIEDAPRFDYRGMQVDLGRHHRSLASMKRLVEQMSAVKLNKLHLGLTNDEGWRIEIPGLPELTDVGGERCHDLEENNCILPQLGSGPTSDNMGSGFFTTEQYVELVKTAQAVGVEVIPEINMPAHARAAVVAMESRYKRLMADGDTEGASEYRLTDPNDQSNVITVQFYDRLSFINPCLDSSHRFVDKVMSEVAAMHQQAGQPLKTWHYGGDEAKNITLGNGFEDINADPKSGKGLMDLSKQDYPFGKSPACAGLIASGEIEAAKELPAWFAIKVGDMVNAKGIDTLQAWQDGLKYASGADAFSTKKVAVNNWETAAGGAAETVGDWGDNGYEVVLSSPDFLYFDFPYEVDPAERGYYWAARFVDLKRTFGFIPTNMAQNAELINDRENNGFEATTRLTKAPIGISGQQWGETVRTDAQFEYMVYPRIYPLAERAWHKPSWELDQVDGRTFGPDSNYVDTDAIEKAFVRFSNVVAKRYLPKLEEAGVNYRLSVPGAVMTDDGYQVNIDLPGVLLEYQQDGNWYAVEGGKAPVTATAVRAVQYDGKRAGRPLPLQK